MNEYGTKKIVSAAEADAGKRVDVFLSAALEIGRAHV